MAPIRSCIICKNKNDKSKFIRIVEDNNIAIYDKNQNINSRGIYICNNKKCINNCIKLINKNKFSTRININKESLLELLNVIESELGE